MRLLVEVPGARAPWGFLVSGCSPPSIAAVFPVALFLCGRGARVLFVGGRVVCCRWLVLLVCGVLTLTAW